MTNIALRNTIISVREISDDSGTLTGLNLRFQPVSQTHIYTTSDRTNVVHDFPDFLYKKGVDLDLNAVIDFTAALHSNISTALYSLREDMPNGGEMEYLIRSKFEESNFLKINVTKHFFKEGNKGRHKVLLSFFEEDEDFGNNELLQIPFTKRDIQTLFNVIIEKTSAFPSTKTLFVPATRVNSETGEEIRDVDIPIVKVGSSLLVGESWLHGQEIMNILYVTEKLNYGFELEKDFHPIYGGYRQVKFSSDYGIAYMEIKTMNGSGEDVDKVDLGTGEKYHLKIALSTYILTIFSLFVSVKMLRHGDMEEDTQSENYAESKKTFSDIKNIKYHVTMKESFIGLGYNNSKKRGEEIIFAAVVKDNAYSVEDESGNTHNLMYESKGEKKMVLDNFSVILGDQWHKLLEGLSTIYTRSYKEREMGFYSKKFFVTKNESGKWYKYEFNIVGDTKNKALGVLTVDKYLIKGKDDYELISSFRQPLFEKYLFQLLIIILNMSSMFEKSDFKIMVDKRKIMRFRFQSMNRMSAIKRSEDVIYGFERTEDSLSWGIFSDRMNMSEFLSDQDIKLLNISSLNRLLRGEWIPFVGEKIAIGQDNFLTDIYGEFNLEEHLNDGEAWASNIFQATQYGEIL